MKRIACLPLAALCLALSACSSLLEGNYSQVEPHADRYWESAADDILRAGSYQDLVNTILLLIEGQEPSGVVRLYLTDESYDQALDMVRRACAEVREETATGSYCLHSMDYSVEELRDSYYEVFLLPIYRRTRADIDSILEISSSSAIYDLALLAWERGEERLTVRYTYRSEDEAALRDNILLLQQELEGGGAEPSGEGGPPDEEGEGTASPLVPWEIYFYPPGGESAIIEIFFHPQGSVEGANDAGQGAAESAAAPGERGKNPFREPG